MITNGGLSDGLILAITFGVTCGAFFALWLVSLRLRDASVVDQYWAIGFAVIGWVNFALAPSASFLSAIFLAGLTVWALRLGIFLSLRHLGMTGEDPRYTHIRNRFSPGFWWKSLAMVFFLQAVLMWLIALPIHAVFLSPQETPLTILFWLGFVVFATGAVIEAIADQQLARFKRSTADPTALCREGLWSISRHPNYFGETITWFGIGICAFALTQAWWVFLGPALITFLLIKVSGIPPLERHLAATRPDFPNYVREVRAFMVLPQAIAPLWDRLLAAVQPPAKGSASKTETPRAGVARSSQAPGE